MFVESPGLLTNDRLTVFSKKNKYYQDIIISPCLSQFNSPIQKRGSTGDDWSVPPRQVSFHDLLESILSHSAQFKVGKTAPEACSSKESSLWE